MEVWRREVRGEKREKKDKWEVGRSLSEGGKILAGRGRREFLRIEDGTTWRGKGKEVAATRPPDQHSLA